MRRDDTGRAPGDSVSLCVNEMKCVNESWHSSESSFIHSDTQAGPHTTEAPCHGGHCRFEASPREPRGQWHVGGLGVLVGGRWWSQGKLGRTGAAGNPHMDHCEAQVQTNNVMWFSSGGGKKGGGGIIDSQRALRFTGHKMEVSRTCCKSGQPVPSMHCLPAFTKRTCLSPSPGLCVPLLDNPHSPGCPLSPW